MDTIARQLDAARHQFKTTYSRQGMEANIVHIGFGAFHRGHQAVYNDLTNEITGNRWGIFELNLFGDAELVDALNAQQGLFSVVETSASAINSRLVRTITGALHTPKSGIQAAIEKLTEPQVKIVSLTITEKGYCTDPRSRTLDLSHPLIKHDLADPEHPRSALGLIVEALRIRRQQGLPPFSVLSCDNIPENGHLTKTAIVTFADNLDPQLAAWIAKHVTFPGTMVDRIVPAMTPEQFDMIKDQIGFADPLMTEEQAKSLRPNLAVDVHQYAQLLIERFSNPNIKHKTGQIAMDGSQKLPQRAVDPYLTLQARGVKGRALATLIAGWLHYVINTLSQGQSVADPLNDTFNAAIKNKNTRWEQALSLLQINSIFGTLAGDNADFLNDIQQAFNHIELHGVTATIHRLSSKG
ncbi:mannitol dehydrogenase family protein [Salmonella enterica]|nr:mannitol dehydrogenase family protein [Salmonella enterica]EBP3038892.1 mannitol dehydrogenase family protein [Salmonella enterica]ECL6692374.1 mannitol dehydrogenase family protein [Salmonella enterica]EJD0496201.1 mannitol dehydrogenase family protein [Salmonella enterica]